MLKSLVPVVPSLLASALIVFWSMCPRPTIAAGHSPIRLAPAVDTYVQARAGEFSQIDPSRRAVLDDLAACIRDRMAQGQPTNLIFICTHNSRRSHMGQVWAAVAAAHFGIPSITTYSGGTEATACNPRTVAALRRAGIEIDKTTESTNPVYHVRYADAAPAVTCFSKKFADPPNPTSGFIAVMTCSDAADKCPLVSGTDARFAIPYEDPKAFDGDKRESWAYDDRCAQIAREMLYIFSRVTG